MDFAGDGGWLRLAISKASPDENPRHVAQALNERLNSGAA